MPKITTTSGGCFIDGMGNEAYHLPSNGASTSTIKDFMKDPASVVWGRNAPQDKSKMPAIDFGTDFHAYFLEPEEFKKNYKVLPTFNRRKADEKQAELDLIAEWDKQGIIAVTDEDFKKLEHMRLSAMAHPTVNAVMNLKNGIAERSFFWEDEQTGLRCKCRPDWLVTGITDDNRPPFMPSDCDTLVMDIKTIAGLDRVQAQIENFKYYVQDPFYTQGVQAVTQGKVCFLFVFVSTTLAIGRYPVQPVLLNDVAVFDGKREIADAMPKYAEMLKASESVWQTVITMDRPSWATREEDLM